VPGASASGRQLHVAIDARLVDYTHGGIAQYTIQLTRALAALGGARFTLLRAARPQVDVESFATVRQRNVWTPPHSRFEQTTLPLELIAVGADVLHSPDFIPPFRRTCRSVITIHDLAFLRFPETMTAQSHRYYAQVRRAVHAADRIIAVSEATRADIHALLGGGDDRVRVIHHGLDPSFYPRAFGEQRLTLDRYQVSGRYLLWVGTFEPRKNLPILLDAFEQIVTRDPGIALVLVGKRGWLDGPIFSRLERLALRGGVRVLEDVPREQLPALYSAAAAFVFPSLYEGFGLPVLEAMACGTPVVAADVASLPEVLGTAGMLVRPDDSAALAEAVLRVLGDATFAGELVARGISRSQEFTWSRAAQLTLQTYREAAA
jgi:glycosyltransferase involved in cell wall biosynthesis